MCVGCIVISLFNLSNFGRGFAVAGPYRDVFLMCSNLLGKLSRIRRILLDVRLQYIDLLISLFDCANLRINE
jgi:hypothetical protein